MCRKHCGKRRNCSLRAISPFPTVFSKDLYCRHVKTRACLGKGLIDFQNFSFRSYHGDMSHIRQFSGFQEDGSCALKGLVNERALKGLANERALKGLTNRLCFNRSISGRLSPYYMYRQFIKLQGSMTC